MLKIILQFGVENLGLVQIRTPVSHVMLRVSPPSAQAYPVAKDLQWEGLPRLICSSSLWFSTSFLPSCGWFLQGQGLAVEELGEKEEIL